MVFIGIIVAIIMFSIIILVHEWGHFAAARKFGVTVEEFGLGIPPRAKKLFYDKKGTLFSLNWLPIGGFVRLKGENPELLADKQDPHALGNKPAWQQAIIILGGVFMNFLLASIIFAVLFMIGVKPIGINDKILTNTNIKIIPTYEQALKQGILIKNLGVVFYPVTESVAYNAGLREGDTITHINNIAISDYSQAVEIISQNAGNSILFEGKNNLKIDIIPDQQGKIGSYISENITFNTNFKYKYGFFESLYYGVTETYNQSILTFQAIGSLLKKLILPETPTQRSEAVAQVSGPIGIVDFISGSLTGGIMFIMIIAAIISINLGVFNLLPIPALDGGRFIFITINGVIKKVFGKKLIPTLGENIIHVMFFVLLIILSILIAYNDIVKIIGS